MHACWKAEKGNRQRKKWEKKRNISVKNRSRVDDHVRGATTFSITTLSITTFSITTLSIKTLSIKTLSIKA